ncbi:hypothetical protein GCM10018952_41200 [Streptosporangium vulgare]
MSLVAIIAMPRRLRVRLRTRTSTRTRAATLTQYSHRPRWPTVSPVHSGGPSCRERMTRPAAPPVKSSKRPDDLREGDTHRERDQRQVQAPDAQRGQPTTSPSRKQSTTATGMVDMGAAPYETTRTPVV